MYTLPVESTATPDGLHSRALIAGPPSPEKPLSVLPATVEGAPIQAANGILDDVASRLSGAHRNLLVIPREGDYLVRLYVEMDKLGEDERVANRGITLDHLVAAAQRDYAAARESCARIGQLADALIAMTCVAPIDGITGHVPAAYAALDAAIAAAPAEDPAIRTWSITALAELSIMRGDYDAAAVQFQRVLALDADDAYARSGLADVLIWQGKPAEASALLAGREVIDNLLVRRAIAEHLANGPEADKWKRAMRDRIAAAAERGDRIHMREEAMFTLAVEGDAKKALATALEDWGVQKEMADARLVANCAVAAKDLAAAEPVRAWMRANHVVDVQLAKALP